MIYIVDEDKIYYNVQKYFVDNYLDKLPACSPTWEREFTCWLKTQGCKIKKDPRLLLRNSLGIAMHYDQFYFDNEQDVLVFMLKWS
jgi:hypothetical protein